MPVAALIAAAGRGSRAAGQDRGPKQYADLGGASLLARSIAPFAAHPAIGAILVVIHADDRALYEAAVDRNARNLLPPVPGGATRQQSVHLGLEALAPVAPDLVLIHDAARPFVDRETIDRILGRLETSTGVIAAEPLADTLKRATAEGRVAGTVDRQGLWRAQTPQGFRYGPLLEAHRKALHVGRSDFTDDAAIAEWAGLDVSLVVGSSRNMKITTAEDMAFAQKMFAPPHETRIGSGFDVHRFKAGDHVTLCGVHVPHTQSLEGHSDADVGLHALTDAILGALADGDIGQHFPPSDVRWKGAASSLFLAEAARRVAARGGRIINVDITLLCEAPRIGPHRAAMQGAIANILGIDPTRVGIKATTTEGLGFTGRREGIAATASAALVLPAER